MKRSTVIGIVVAAVVVFAGAGIGLALWQSSDAGPTVSEIASTPAGAAAPGKGRSTTQPNANGSETAPTPTPTPGQKLDEWGTTGQPAPTLPPVTPYPHLLVGSAPKDASSDGSLVKGFPDSLPAAPHSKVRQSSLASEGSRLQASLTATSKGGVDDILAFYRSQLAKYGMYDSPSPATGGQTAVTFKRDDDTVTLAITPDDAGVSYVLFGTLTAHEG